MLDRSRICWCLPGMLLLGGCDASSGAKSHGWVDEARLLAGDADNCCIVGLGCAEDHYTTLDHIHDHNVATLGFQWESQPIAGRVVVAPLVIDGFMFVADSQGQVDAFDAGTGKRIWHFEPESSEKTDLGHGNACGLATWHGRIYTVSPGSLLIALDAATGERQWSSDTVRKIIGTPQIARDRVIVTGADSTNRNVVSALQTETGEPAWSLRLASTAGDADDEGLPFGNLVYDPVAGLLYIGTGKAKGSDGKQSDESQTLVPSSVVAIDPETGRVAWQTPTLVDGATQPMVLADLEIDGQTRNVIMQATADGSLAIWDRTNGELIATQQYNSKATESDRVVSLARNVRKELVLVLGTTESKEDDSVPAWFLQAWNPLTSAAPWKITFEEPCAGGGLLSTSGNLTMLGDQEGYLDIYAAEEGKLIERVHLGGRLTCPPVTYVVDGVQRIAVVVETDAGSKVVSLELGGITVPGLGESNADQSALKTYPSRVKRQWGKSK